uniref:Uncharacterized protein n=1 Tax=Anguilla anguilla TaxID=7936 RepID=A0A0E9TLV8_ANGAN
MSKCRQNVDLFSLWGFTNICYPHMNAQAGAGVKHPSKVIIIEVNHATHKIKGVSEVAGEKGLFEPPPPMTEYTLIIKQQ